MGRSRKTLYHEVQESKLCALHCVNSVLQGPLFSELDLAAMASDLDRAEKQMMLGSVSGDFLPEVSHNVSRDGNFSIQVLTKALEVWDLQVIPLDNPEARPAQIDPESENAYICHLHDHWFCLRKVDNEWYNFDSLHVAPEHLSKFYLSAYLDTLKTSGWSIFLVRGNLPKCPIKGSNNYGRWMSPEDAKRIISTSSRKRDRANRRRRRCSSPVQMGNSLDDDEEEDKALKEAIAASLKDSPPENKKHSEGSVETDERDGKRVKEAIDVSLKESPPENKKQNEDSVEDDERGGKRVKEAIDVSLKESLPENKKQTEGLVENDERDGKRVKEPIAVSLKESPPENKKQPEGSVGNEERDSVENDERAGERGRTEG